ncbi:hypothetical protein AK830_g10308 [Neonectria ditissima]|uniref:Transcription factor CBF/NF-Y/archaeal histone domain-containing protein n=1 Tax=Neonectria ditissima TaxID=78410 RepID=A0A0P7ATJ2_9HYPO|nr:hypothetical protein AK830_g10308 [Neonectria ditissima]
MSADDGYAPKSPDLSSFFSAGPTQPAPQRLHRPQAASSHLDLEYKAEPPSHDGPSASSYAAQPADLNDHNHQPRYHPQPQYPPPHQTIVKAEYQNYSPPLQHQYTPPSPTQRQPAHLGYGVRPLLGTQPQEHASPSYGQPCGEQNIYPVVAPPHAQPYAPGLGVVALQPPPNATEAPSIADMPPRKAPPPPAPEIDPSPVRTKFPTARIKRIMQADEEVGKVAQQTPIAVGKALEMFMIQLVTKSADVAKEKGSKRVTAPMLKHVVETDEQWDFLRDIVSRVENEKEGSKAKAKPESSSDEEMEEPKKRTRGGRKKKAA